MSTEDQVEAGDMTERILTAEYKDGQLQIVEVIPLDRSEHELSGHLEPGTSSAGQEQSYVQVMDADKNLLKLDLLNLALLKCQNGEDGYRLVTNSKTSESDGENDTTITCVLQSSDGEEVDNESYVIMDGGQGPMVFLQSELAQTEEEDITQTVSHAQPPSSQQPTPVEILERAKAIQKARANLIPSKRRGRKRKGSLPSPHELLSSPNFKLYLYSCRSCDFKCNAVKELTQHRASEHGAGGKYRVRTACLQCAHCPYRANLYSQLENHIKEKHKGSTSINKIDGKILQCAKCPFQSNLHSQILKHVRDKHPSKQTNNVFSNELFLNSISAETADILVCGACGFESGDKQSFKQHVIEEHGDNSC